MRFVGFSNVFVLLVVLKKAKMKEIGFYLLFAFLVLNSYGQVAPSQIYPLSEHMEHINQEWRLHQDLIEDCSVRFDNDEERIACHLRLVIDQLEKSSTLGLSPKAANQRQALLDSLRTYAEQKRFPINNYYVQRTPCFIDDFNTHCAVGHLMKVSGDGALALQVSKEHNYDYLKNIKTPGVKKWAHAHGFTLEELAWIQPSYGTPSYTFGLGKSIDGPVTSMWNYNDSLLYIAGGFSTLGDAPCSGLMTYDGEELRCMETRLKGQIQDMAMGHDGLYLVGNLSLSSRKGQLARLNKDGLVLYSSFDEDFTAGKEIYVDTSMGNDRLRVACFTPFSKSVSKVYDFKNNRGVLALELFGLFGGMTKDAVAGEFDSVKLIQDDGTLRKLKSASLLFFDGEKWTPFYEGVNNHLVTEVEYWNGATYVFDLFNPDLRVDDSGRVDTFLDKYELMAWINDVEFSENGDAMMCGPRSTSDSTDRSDHVFYAGQGWASPGGSHAFIGTLNVIKNFKGKTIVGGDFFTPEYHASTMDETSDYLQPKIGFLVWLGGNLSIPEQNAEQHISVYPNPANQSITIRSKAFLSKEVEPRVLDVIGKYINLPMTRLSESWVVDVSGLQNGHYVASINDGGNSVTATFIISR